MECKFPFCLMCKTNWQVAKTCSNSAKLHLNNSNCTFALALFFQLRAGFDTLMGELGRVPSNILVALMCLFDDS